MFKDIFEFNDLIDEVEKCINDYERRNICNSRYKLTLANGDYVVVDYNDNCLPHLLGINIDYLRSTGFYKGNAFDILKDIIDNSQTLYQRIKNGIINPNYAFSKYIDEKLDNFNNICDINIFNLEFVAKYDSSKSYNTGLEKLNGNYYFAFTDQKNKNYLNILGVKKDPDGKYQPMTNLRFDKEKDNTKEFLDKLLTNQTITIVSKEFKNSIINGCFIDKKSFFYDNENKRKKISILRKYKNNFDCDINISEECIYFIDTTINLAEEKLLIWKVLDKIAESIKDNESININELEEEYVPVKQSLLNLISAYNDSLLRSSLSSNEASISYKKLIEDIRLSKLEITRLESLIQKLEENNKELTDKVSTLSIENTVLKENEQKIRKILG